MNRRNFMQAMLATCVPPAFVRYGSLMVPNPRIDAQPLVVPQRSALDVLQNALKEPMVRIYSGVRGDPNAKLMASFSLSHDWGRLKGETLQLPTHVRNSMLDSSPPIAARDSGLSLGGGAGFVQETGVATHFELVSPVDGKAVLTGKVGTGFDADMHLNTTHLRVGDGIEIDNFKLRFDKA